jgi:hypothetical protein
MLGLAIRESRGPHIEGRPGGLRQRDRPAFARLCLTLTHLENTPLQVQILSLELPNFLVPHTRIQTENGNRVEGSPISLPSSDNR